MAKHSIRFENLSLFEATVLNAIKQMLKCGISLKLTLALLAEELNKRPD